MGQPISEGTSNEHKVIFEELFEGEGYGNGTKGGNCIKGNEVSDNEELIKDTRI